MSAGTSAQYATGSFFTYSQAQICGWQAAGGR